MIVNDKKDALHFVSKEVQKNISKDAIISTLVGMETAPFGADRKINVFSEVSKINLDKLDYGQPDGIYLPFKGQITKTSAGTNEFFMRLKIILMNERW